MQLLLYLHTIIVITFEYKFNINDHYSGS